MYRLVTTHETHRKNVSGTVSVQLQSSIHCYVSAMNRPNIKVSIRIARGTNKRKAITKMFNP